MLDIANRDDIASALFPPLAQAGDELDLEFSLLLAFDSIVFDRYSVERLASYDHPTIRRIVQSLRILEDAGFLVSSIAIFENSSLTIFMRQAGR